MADTATAVGPVVRMCEYPECRGAMTCPAAARDRAKITDRTLGVSEVIGATIPAGVTDEAACDALARSIAYGYALDSHGVMRIIPDGCEFTVHKGNEGIPPDMLAQHGSGEWCAAIYSGAATCIDDILGDAPEYDWEADPVNGLVRQRMHQMAGTAGA